LPGEVYWLELYDVIRSLLGFSLEDDLEAGRLADSLMLEALLRGRAAGMEEVCGVILESRRVCVTGAAATLARQINDVWGCDAVIAADGSSCLLLDNGVVPDIVVTDLDGPLSCILRANTEGGRVVVHSHGDNMDMVVAVSPYLTRVLYTVQVKAVAAVVIGGFTDGDRALALVLHCLRHYGGGTGEVVLLGMDFKARVGPWSKPGLRKPVEPWPLKRAKLRIGQLLVDKVLVPGLEAMGVRVVRP